MGNKTGDWNNTELQRIDPNQGGVLPKIVVILSNQIYNIVRYPNNDPVVNNRCRIKEITVRSSVAFSYVKRIAQAGTQIMIRLYPSPGNFDDWSITDPQDPNYRKNHNLRTGNPVSGNYCQPDRVRNPLDLADEMIKIHKFNGDNGFVELGFEPANEPNIEWYSTTSLPELFKDETWTSMNSYFSEVYSKVTQNNPPLNGIVRVFTPPMAQGQYAEGINWSDCSVQNVIPSAVKGYEKIRNTYEISSHGISWHNYWNLNKEIYNSCPNGGNHVSWYFPQWMKDAIRNNSKPVVITEADLNSPTQGGNVQNKNSNPTTTANSLRHFFYSEWFYGGNTNPSNYGVRPSIALWLLNDNVNNSSTDHNWHEAYVDNGSTYTEYNWFREWYTGIEYGKSYLPTILK